MPETIVKHFQRMGVRCQVQESSRGPVSIDIRRDGKGEYFLVRRLPEVQLEVLQVAPKDRHLVLLSRDGRTKSRFLCGHDEREWFVAAIPERTPVSTVKAAKEALRPPELPGDAGLRKRERGKRHTSAYKRQGEWFFIPRPGFDPGDTHIHHNEIITRSGRGGTPHVCEELVRYGGETVYITRGGSSVSPKTYEAMDRRNQAKYSQQVSGMTVLVRGKIRHPDHKTLKLDIWHEVMMNTEQSARAMSHVAFID